MKFLGYPTLVWYTDSLFPLLGCSRTAGVHPLLVLGKKLF